MNKKLTPEEGIELLHAMKAGLDAESAHDEADDVLLGVLRFIGQDEVADAFQAACDRVGFWYA